jgi:hypothetical protein
VVRPRPPGLVPDDDVIRERVRFSVVIIAAAGEDVDHLLKGYRAPTPLHEASGAGATPLPDVVSSAARDGADQRVVGGVPVCGDLDLNRAAAAIRRGARRRRRVQA